MVVYIKMTWERLIQLSLSKKRPKNNFQTQWCQLLVIAPLHRGSSSIQLFGTPCIYIAQLIFITHSLFNSLTDSLTNCCLVNLIDVALACKDANSKLVEVVTVAHVDAEDHVGNSLLQIWELTFGPKAKLLFRL